MYPSCPEEFAPDFEYNSGWAKRPQVGKMYGTKNLEPYKEEIEILYHSGEKDKKKQDEPCANVGAFTDTASKGILSSI